MAIVQFNLRIPEELKKMVDEASSESGRSINAEAAYRLEQSFVESGSNADLASLHKQLSKLTQEVTRLSTESREMRKLYIEAVNSGIEGTKKPTD